MAQGTIILLMCEGADGIHREFVCVVTESDQVYDLMKRPADSRRHWRYRVYENEDARLADGAHCCAEFVKLDDGRVISRDMQAPDQLRKLGIAEAVICHMAQMYVVVSSSSRDAELLRGESQSEAAAKVWRRLASRRLARKVEVDRFETTTAPPSRVDE